MLRTLIYGFAILISTHYSAPCAAEQSSPAKPVVMVFGDSLSAAYNIPVNQGWVSLLQNLLDQKGYRYSVVNASISGETTAGGLERFGQQLNRHQPSLVILELGGNDGLRGLDLADTRQNLTAMIEIAQRESVRVLLAGIKLPPNYGMTYTSRFEAIYADLAKSYQLPLIPFVLERVAGKPKLMQADGIHPTKEAQPLVLETVAEYLLPLLQVSANEN